jgi:hypothetical protein
MELSSNERLCHVEQRETSLIYFGLGWSSKINSEILRFAQNDIRDSLYYANHEIPRVEQRQIKRTG